MPEMIYIHIKVHQNEV